MFYFLEKYINYTNYYDKIVFLYKGILIKKLQHNYKLGACL